MKVGFQLLEFPAFEHIVVSPANELPKHVHLKLGGREADPKDIKEFWISLVLRGLAQNKEVSNLFALAGTNIRMLDQSTHRPIRRPHVCYVEAIGLFDRLEKKGSVILSDTRLLEEQDIFLLVMTDKAGTRRLLDDMNLQ